MVQEEVILLVWEGHGSGSRDADPLIWGRTSVWYIIITVPSQLTSFGFRGLLGVDVLFLPLQ